MTDPAVPQRLAFEKRIADLERKVRDLQRTPILTSASVTGYLRTKDGSGNESVRIGDIGDGDQGMRLLGPTGQELLRVTANGWTKPYYPVPMASLANQLPTSSASFVELARGRFHVTSQYIRYAFRAEPNGATMETRVLLRIFTGAFPTITVGQWTDTAGTDHNTFVDIASVTPGGTDPWGAEATIHFEARRVSGAPVPYITVQEHSFLFGA